MEKCLELGYSKRVQQFKMEGIEHITLSYKEYKEIQEKAELWGELMRLDDTEKSMFTIEEFIERFKREREF